jgi:hypothetical protein
MTPVLKPSSSRTSRRGSRCFSKLKQLRAVATRYDKRGYMYQATIDVTSIRVWLPDPSDLRDTPGTRVNE